MVSFIHYPVIIYCFLSATTASWTPPTSTGYLTYGKSATPLGVCINRNKNGEPFSRKYYCNSDKSAVMIASWYGYNCNTSSSAPADTKYMDATHSSGYFDCSTSVKYWMGMSYGNQTGACAQEDANWEQVPLVVQQCIAVTYLNGKAASGQARWIRNCDACSCERVHYKTASCITLTGDHTESISVGCVNGECKVADPNQCSIEQKCPAVNATTTAEPSSATIEPKVTNSSGEYYVISREERTGNKSIICSSANCHVLCTDSFSCTNMKIDFSTMSNYRDHHLSLYCNGEYSCHNALVDAAYIGLLDVYCKGTNACSHANVSCPAKSANVCNIHCTKKDACASFDIKTSYEYTPGSVHVFCQNMHSNYPSCNDVYFHCDKSSSSSSVKTNTFLKYNVGGNSSQCVANETVVSGDDYCCPLFPAAIIEPTVTNSSGEYYVISRNDTAGSKNIICSSANCHVLCTDSFSCTNLNISAYDAISLTVECPSNRSCIESNIMCPKQNLSSIESFSFCDISCGDALSCANASIEVHAVHRFNLLCTAHKACSYTKVWLPDPAMKNVAAEMKNVSVKCTEKASCEHLRFFRKTGEGFQMGLDTLDIQCTGEESCQFMRWQKDLFSQNATVQCIGYKSCQHVVFWQIYSRYYFNLHCGASLACYAMSANVLSLQSEQTIITCDNPATSSNATGACYQSRIKFGNYATNEIPGDINISCSAFDCQNMNVRFFWNDYDEHHLSLYCSDEYSCHNALFDGILGSLDVYCKGTNACSHTNVMCPTGSANVCNIHCTDGEDVCASFGIKTAYKYTTGAVHVFCESMDSNPSCNDVYFHCDKGHEWRDGDDGKVLVYLYKTDTFLKYNDGGNNSQCVVNGTVVSDDVYCCPLFTKDVIKPTVTNSSDITEETTTSSTDIIEPTVTNPNDEKQESKKENKSWPIAATVACVAVVTLIVITCVLTVFVVKKRRKGKRSPALLDDDGAKQGTYEPPKGNTEMTKNEDFR